MPIASVILINLAAIGSVLLALWFVSLIRKDASIIDLFWGLGFVLVAWISLCSGGHWSPKAILLALLVSVWGLRLSGYLAWRNWRKPEDHRYAAMRESHGKYFPIVSLLTVFGLQGLLMLIIALPLQVGLSKPAPWNILATIGAVTWGAGLFFEAVGDYQLASFKADPSNRGQVMSRGLWRYTRHPNYFGDFLIWWGFYLIAAEPGAWWWTIVSPVLMSFLLIRVSGVKLLESSLRSRVAGYEDYVRNTSAFFPLPPRQSSSSK